MELFVTEDEVRDSEMHNFASLSGLSFVIFKHNIFENIITNDICDEVEYETEVGLIDAQSIDLFNVMECSFKNITLASKRHIIRANDIMNHMALQNTISDIVLADKARMVHFIDF